MGSRSPCIRSFSRSRLRSVMVFSLRSRESAQWCECLVLLEQQKSRNRVVLSLALCDVSG